VDLKVVIGTWEPAMPRPWRTRAIRGERGWGVIGTELA